MVWFIDELVHHSTPHKNPPPSTFNLAIGGSQFVTGLTADVTPQEEWAEKPSNDRFRQFVRIWITLEPKRLRQKELKPPPNKSLSLSLI